MIRYCEILLLIFLMSLLTIGCSQKNISSIPTTPSTTEIIPKVEITDAYCLDTQSAAFPFRFTLVNQMKDSLILTYEWTLNDPLASFGDITTNYSQGIVYQGEGEVTLKALERKELEMDVKITREYDPKFYGMNIRVFQEGRQIIFYHGSKGTNKWDYSTTPPVLNGVGCQ